MKHAKCTRCGWKHGTFHICLDIEVPNQVVVARPVKRKRPVNYSPVDNGQALRRRRERDENAERDQQMVDRYHDGDVGYEGLAREFDTSRSNVQKIMKKAENDGKVVLRRRGATIAKGY